MGVVEYSCHCSIPLGPPLSGPAHNAAVDRHCIRLVPAYFCWVICNRNDRSSSISSPFQGDSLGNVVNIYYLCSSRCCCCYFSKNKHAHVYLWAEPMQYAGFKGDGSEQCVALECCIVVIFPYCAYMLAESLQLSGIVAILFCGIVMAHYTRRNLSKVVLVHNQGWFGFQSRFEPSTLFFSQLPIFSIPLLVSGGTPQSPIILQNPRVASGNVCFHIHGCGNVSRRTGISPLFACARQVYIYIFF